MRWLFIRSKRVAFGVGLALVLSGWATAACVANPASVPSPSPAPEAVLVLEAERFAGVVEMPNENYAAAQGWTAYSQSFYAGRRAAITRVPGGALFAPLAHLPPGDYRVTLVVYDYGTAEANRVALTLNGVSATVAWSGTVAGVRPVVVDLRGTGGGRELSIKAVERGQPYVIVDQVRIEAPG